MSRSKDGALSRSNSGRDQNLEKVPEVSSYKEISNVAARRQDGGSASDAQPDLLLGGPSPSQVGQPSSGSAERVQDGGDAAADHEGDSQVRDTHWGNYR